MDFDFIAKNAPIDRKAAIVMQKGEHFESEKKIQEIHSNLPIKCNPIPKGCEDLTGTRFGSFVVIGYHHRNKKTGSNWVVRCSCGYYEVRKSKAIRNPKNNIDCCQLCREVQYMRRNSAYKDGLRL